MQCCVCHILERLVDLNLKLKNESKINQNESKIMQKESKIKCKKSRNVSDDMTSPPLPKMDKNRCFFLVSRREAREREERERWRRKRETCWWWSFCRARTSS